MKKYDDLMKIKICEKEYDIYIFYKNIKNVYLSYKGNNVFILRGAIYNMQGINFELFLITSMKKQIDKLKRRKNIENKLQASINFLNNTFFYLGKKVTFKFDNQEILIFEDDNLIDRIINFAKNIDELYIKSLIEEWSNNKLLFIFQRYAEEANLLILNKDFNFKYLLKNKTTSWASINIISNKIYINCDLKYFSESIIKYVAYHEIIHKVENNHSKNFWLIVKKYCPDYKDKIFKLNNYIFN